MAKAVVDRLMVQPNRAERDKDEEIMGERFLLFLLLILILTANGCQEEPTRTPTVPAYQPDTFEMTDSEDLPITKPPRRIETH